MPEGHLHAYPSTMMIINTRPRGLKVFICDAIVHTLIERLDALICLALGTIENLKLKVLNLSVGRSASERALLIAKDFGALG